MRKKHKAVGSRGSWFATVDGEALPCCHKHWLSGRIYRDPGLFASLPKVSSFVEAIEAKKKIILTDDNVVSTDPMVVFERKSYIAVFAIKDVRWCDNELTFEIVDRLCDLV